MNNQELNALTSVFKPWDLGFKPACTLDDVAKEMGCSRPYVRLLEYRGLLLMAIELHARGFRRIDDFFDPVQIDSHKCGV